MADRLSLDEEARLYTTNAQCEKYNNLATLFGIIVALDYLERAYVRDSITAAECVSELAPESAPFRSPHIATVPMTCRTLLPDLRDIIPCIVYLSLRVR